MDIHWAHDPEKLRGYILGKVPEQERSALEAHAAHCSECQIVVARERQIIAGVRAYGRKKLKEDLKERLGEAQNKRVPWNRLVSAAAVIMVLLGIGIYNNWFVLERPSHETTLARKDDAVPPGTGHNQSVETTPAGKNRDEPGGLPSKPRKGDVKFTRPSGTADEKKPVGKDLAEFKEKAMKPAASQSGAGAGGQPSEKQDIDDEMRAREARGLQSQIWIDGILIPESDESRGKAKRLSEKTPTVMQKDEMGRLISPSVSQQRITLVQRSTEGLPLEQRQKQQFAGVSTVPTLIERTNEGLRMILYLESAVSESSLHHAQIQRPEDDSLVLEFDRRRIGYRIPAQFFHPTPKNPPQK
jgi:hypothetical protein